MGTVRFGETEHTAYLRLKDGIRAPDSGSAQINGTVVAEQIGAQIFIDGWAMVSPGDADQAARLVTQAARVSHDRAAVDGAVVLAVMEALAFVESISTCCWTRRSAISPRTRLFVVSSTMCAVGMRRSRIGGRRTLRQWLHQPWRRPAAVVSAGLNH